MIVLPCVLFGNFELQAATATNAYVTVSCSTYGVEDVVPVGADFYITTRNVSKPSFRADISVKANSPYYLVKPGGGRMNLGIGESDEYRVRDESGNEDEFSGHVYVLKLDIEPAETNVCWKSTSCTLKLTNDSFPGGTAEWTSSPAGISGRGNSITFSPNSLTAGVYTVTARSGIVSSYTDTCIVRVVKIEFITPDGDPVLSPVDSGDGQNEFTFSGANPGILTMDLKAKVIPASAASAITGCQFNVGDIGSSVKNWAVNNPNGKAAAGGGNLIATVTFTGLPDNNSDFGKKTATVSWNGVICDTKDYEVFFSKTATNHPGEPIGSPNWFYYWKNGAVCGIPADSEFDPNGDFGWTHPQIDSRIRLGPDAAGENDGPQTFIASAVGYGSISVGGNGKGIQCVAETILHEQHHVQIFNRFNGRGNDPDGDGIPSSEEPTEDGISTLANDPDTYRMGSSYSDYGDQEVRCRKIEQTQTLSVHPEQDWANPGCQSKDQFGPSPR